MNFIGLSDVIVAIPYILLLIGALGPIMIKVMMGNKEPSNFLTSIQSAGALIAALIALVTVFKLLLVREDFFAFNQLIQIDRAALLAGIPILVLLVGNVFFLRDNVSINGRGFAEVIFLILSSSLGMLLVTQAADLLMLFVGLEVMSLPLYVTIGLGHDNYLSKESAIKYFVLGSFASALFLMGTALLYGVSGTTNLNALQSVMSQLADKSQWAELGALFLLGGLFFKVSLFPLHLWTADVYQGAPTGITAVMAGAIKLASMLALYRVIPIGFFGQSELWLQAIQWIATLTILVGNTAALWQTQWKRVLAFSSVAHSGYIFVGLLPILSQNGSNNSATTESYFFFYLMTYALASSALFGFIGALENQEGAQISLNDLKGLARRRPFEAWLISFLLLTLAGIPPFVGFFAKAYVILNALEQGFLWVSIWAMIGSVMGVYYYLRPIVHMFMAEPESEVLPVAITQDENKLSVIFVAIAAGLSLVLGVWHGPILGWMQMLP
jgi:NADH-quinone oxidoreductase subunit N